MANLSLIGTGPVRAEDGGASASPRVTDLHPKRRRWPVCEKVRIVSESFVPVASDNSMAVHHGLDATTLCNLATQAMRGELDPVLGILAASAVVPLILDECGA